jgi:response regulator RpfG family c-di-GMP phosphodiesterase
MDIRMPGHYGNDIARRIRSVEALKHIPIVLMTAFNVTESDRKKFYDEDGVDHLINKPLPEMDKLKTLLDDIHAQKVKAAKDGDTPKNGEKPKNGDTPKDEDTPKPDTKPDAKETKKTDTK